MPERYDLAVLGGGPGGYTAAIRASQLGLRTVLVERDRLGGVCGNWGCIPSKAIIRSAEIYENARQGERLGIVPGTLSFDYARIVANSRAAAERVSRGVAGLLAKNDVTVVSGEGRLDREGRLVVDESGVLADPAADPERRASVLGELLSQASPSPRSIRAGPDYRLAMLPVLATRAIASALERRSGRAA